MRRQQGSSDQQSRPRERVHQAGIVFLASGRASEKQSRAVFSKMESRGTARPVVSRVRTSREKKTVHAEAFQSFGESVSPEGREKGILPAPCRESGGESEPDPGIIGKKGGAGAVAPGERRAADNGSEFRGRSQTGLLLQPLNVGRTGPERAFIDGRRRLRRTGKKQQEREKGGQKAERTAFHEGS